MFGKRVIVVLLAIAAGGFVYPLAAQQAPSTSPKPTPEQNVPGASRPAAPSQPPAIPRRIPAPTAAGQGQNVPAPQPPGAAQTPAPQAASPEGSPAAQPGPVPSFPGRRALPSPSLPAGGMVSLNFNRADLIEIIHIIAQQLRLTYTIDPEVKGTVTINSAEPLRPEDLLPIFHQLLRMNGAVAVRTGNLYHIMPIKDGKGLARPIGQSREDSFALQIIPVRFFSVAEMRKVLAPFLQPGAEIIENPRGNFLVVMDLPSNIQRLMEIADMIDVQVFAGTRMEIYQPKVASAEELAQEMTKVMQSFGASVPQAESFTAQFIPLPRINQLLVISHSEAAWTYARRWLDRIDVVAEGPGRRIFIYAVENGKATELADVINRALGQPSTGGATPSQTLQSLHRATTPTGPGQQQGGAGGSGSPFGSQGSPGQQQRTGFAQATIAAPGQQPTPGVGAPQQQAAAPGVPRPPTQPAAPAAQEQLRIVADPATNSLIIYGTVQEFQNIRNILKELDAIPRQVLIEALVLQVNLSDSEKLGFDYELGRKLGDVRIFDREFGSRGAGLFSGVLPGIPTGGGLSSFPGGVSGIIAGGNAVRAFVNALMTDSRVRVLSSPSVLATDNRPARIQVGTEEPVPTGTINAATGGTGVSSSTTVQYRNTGRILTIIPQVNSQGLVNLQVKAEVSARGDSVSFGGGTSADTATTFPTFETQDAETTAVIQDGETLVIGGLIGERKSRDRSGIPYLMDLPVIGRFFGRTSEETRRTELIMLITPRVIRNRDDARAVTAEFRSHLSTVRNELERLAQDRQGTQPKPRSVQPPPPMPPPPPIFESPGDAPPLMPPPGPQTFIAPAAPTMAQMATPAVPAPAVILPVVPLSDPRAKAQPAEIGQAINPRAVAKAMATAGAKVATVFTPPTAKPTSVKTPVSLVESPAPIAPTRRRLWSVQVAAGVVMKDAHKLAGQLRKEGYNAFVTAVQIDTKTWYRVRIGQVEGLRAAIDLRRYLIANKPFKDAFVTPR